MKKLIAIATIITVAIMLSIAYAMPACAEEDNEFPTVTAAVIELNYTEDTVSCIDQAGKIWTFYGINEYEGETITHRYQLGDVVSMVVWSLTDEILAIDCVDHLEVMELARWIEHAQK